jgi:hypothetical protein
MHLLNFTRHIKIILLASLIIFSSCDSGEKVIDKATGNQDIKQYKEMKKNIGKIADQKAERYKQIPDENNK